MKKIAVSDTNNPIKAPAISNMNRRVKKDVALNKSASASVDLVESEITEQIIASEIVNKNLLTDSNPFSVNKKSSNINKRIRLCYNDANAREIKNIISQNSNIFVSEKNISKFSSDDRFDIYFWKDVPKSLSKKDLQQTVISTVDELDFLILSALQNELKWQTPLIEDLLSENHNLRKTFNNMSSIIRYNQIYLSKTSLLNVSVFSEFPPIESISKTHIEFISQNIFKLPIGTVGIQLYVLRFNKSSSVKIKIEDRATGIIHFDGLVSVDATGWVSVDFYRTIMSQNNALKISVGASEGSAAGAGSGRVDLAFSHPLTTEYCAETKTERLDKTLAMRVNWGPPVGYSLSDNNDFGYDSAAALFSRDVVKGLLVQTDGVSRRLSALPIGSSIAISCGAVQKSFRIVLRNALLKTLADEHLNLSSLVVDYSVDLGPDTDVSMVAKFYTRDTKTGRVDGYDRVPLGMRSGWRLALASPPGNIKNSDLVIDIDVERPVNKFSFQLNGLRRIDY